MQRLFDKQQPGQPDHPRHEHRPRSHHLSPENVQGDKTSSCKWVKHASGPAGSSSLSSSWSARDKTAKTCSKGYQTLSNIKAGSAPGQPLLASLVSSARGKMSSHKKHQTTGSEPMTAAIVASCWSCCADRGFCSKPNQLHANQSPLQTCHINWQINHCCKNAKWMLPSHPVSMIITVSAPLLILSCIN